MKFYEKTFPFETYFPNFGPRKSVDFSVVLEDNDSHVGNG